MPKQSKILVVVCTLNEELTIERKFLNIEQLNIPAHASVSVALMDNSSSDNTQALTMEIASKGKLDVMFRDTGRVGKCRSIFRAIEEFALKYDFFVFTDANTILANDSLCEILKSFSNSSDENLIVCNMRHVKTDAQGHDFLNQRTVRFGLRHRLEKVLGISSGANGGLYAVRAVALTNIPTTNPVRNDDYIISCFSQINGGVIWNNKAKAYEIEYRRFDLFNAKIRDAQGHLQAMYWIINNIKSPKRIYFTMFRLILWATPALILSILIVNLGMLVSTLFCTVLFFSPSFRILLLKMLALYIGIFVSIFKKTTVTWTPKR